MALVPPDEEWIAWGGIRSERRGRNNRSSRFWSQYTLDATVPCCAEFNIPLEQDSIYVYGAMDEIGRDPETFLRFQITGGKFCPLLRGFCL